MSQLTPFDKRIENVPASWKRPLVEVIDTAETIAMGLRDGNFGLRYPAVECPELVAKLTKLAIELHQTFGARCCDE